MLKSSLLATTFFVVVGSMCFTSAHTGAAQSGFGAAPGYDAFLFRVHPKDRNAEFLCTYGYRVSFYVYSGSLGSNHRAWRKYAVPIIGKGASVSKIEVTDARASNAKSEFNVSIHKDHKNKPGNLIAGGSGRPMGSCLLTTVVIPKIFLTAGVR